MRVRREVMLIAESGSSYENKASETLSESKSHTELLSEWRDRRMPTHHTPVMCARQEFRVCGSLSGGDGARWFLVRRAYSCDSHLAGARQLAWFAFYYRRTQRVIINQHASITAGAFHWLDRDFSGPLHFILIGRIDPTFVIANQRRNLLSSSTVIQLLFQCKRKNYTAHLHNKKSSDKSYIWVLICLCSNFWSTNIFNCNFWHNQFWEDIISYFLVL